MIEISCKECFKIFKAKNRKFKLCLVCSSKKKLERCRLYKKINKEYVSDYNKKYKKDRKEYITKYNKKYNIENREKRQTEHNKMRRKTDSAYKISIVLRNRFRKFFKGIKIKSMKNIVGCSYENYMK